MRLSLCNEVLGSMSLADQCAFAKAVGYDGLEIAPFTLAQDSTVLGDREIAGIRSVVEDHGLVVTSLHWLAAAPEGLSITALDSATAERTRRVLLRLIDIAAGLGARTLVHGSPAQRRLDVDPPRQRAVAVEHFRRLGSHAAACGLTYCIEAINRNECNFINRLEQAELVMAEAGTEGLGLMLDVSHAAQEEGRPLDELISFYGARRFAHVQLNAINRRGPGESDDPDGRDRIAPVLGALIAGGYDGDLAVEPFVYQPDGPACAARAAGYLRGLLEQKAIARR